MKMMPNIRDLKMEDCEVWDKLRTEPNHAYAAFAIYRNMGVERSISKAFKFAEDNANETVEVQFNTSQVKWQKWSLEFSWERRAMAYDSYLDKKAKDFTERIVAEEHAKNYSNFLIRQRQMSGKLFTSCITLADKLQPAIESINLSNLTIRELTMLMRTLGTTWQAASDAEAYALGIDVALANKLTAVDPSGDE